MRERLGAASRLMRERRQRDEDSNVTKLPELQRGTSDVRFRR